MPIMVTFLAPGATREQYETVRRDIGWDNAPPVGALLHMAYFDDEGVHSVDLWDSPAALDAYLVNRFNPAAQRAGLPAAVLDPTDIQVVAASPDLEAYFVGAPAVA